MKSETELKNRLERCGHLAIKSLGSRTPVDVIGLKGSEVFLFQIKETGKSKVYYGEDIKKLNKITSDLGLKATPVLAIKFLETGKWILCNTKKLDDEDATGISEENKNCRELKECNIAVVKEDDVHERRRESRNSLMDSYS